MTIELVSVARLDINQLESDAARAAQVLADLERERQLDLDGAAFVREVQKIDRQTKAILADRDVKLELDQGSIINDLNRVRAEFDNLVAEVEIDGDTTKLQQAFDLAERINNVSAFVDVDTDGVSELKDVLDIGQQLEQLNAVVTVQARDEALRDAVDLAEQLERDREFRVTANERGIQSALDTAEALERPREIPVSADVDEQSFIITPQLDTTEIVSQLAALDLSGAGRTVAESLSGSLKSNLSNLATARGGVGIAGLAIGAALVAGAVDGVQRQQASLELALRTGFDSTQMAAVGSAAGDAYVAGFGESTGDLRNIAASIEGELRSVDLALDLSETTKQVALLRDIFEVDLATSIRNTQRLITQGLVGDTQAALDLQVAAAQEYSNSFEEIFEVTNEFGGVFGKVGIEGAEAVELIGSTFRDGLLPNIDRGAELIEEFNIRLSDGTAREAIEALGLEFGTLQDQLARGDGADSLRQITAQLLSIQDESARTELALAIFGTPIESAADLDEVLRRLRDSTDGVTEGLSNAGSAAQDAGEQFEQSFTSLLFADFREAQTDLAAFNVELGKAATAAADFFDSGNSGGLLGFAESAETTSLWGAAVRDLAGSLVGFTDDAEAAAGVGRDVDAAFGLIAESGRDIDAAFGLIDGSGTRGELEEVAEGAAIAFEQTEALEESVSALRDELNQFFDFSADALFRDIAANASDLTDELTGLDRAVIDAAGNINISTEEGRAFEETLESQAKLVAELAEAYADPEGGITGAEFSEGLQQIESDLTAALTAMGFNVAEVDRLVEQYAKLPDEIKTRFVTEVDELAFREFTDRLSELPEETVLKLGFELDDEEARRQAFRAVEVLEALSPKIVAEIDVNDDGLVSVTESVAAFNELSADATVGFDVDGSGEIEFLERARALEGFQFAAALGFDVDYSGKLDADEEAKAFDAIEAFAELGFDLDQSGKVESEELGAAFAAEQFLASIGYVLDDGEIVRAQGQGEAFDSSTFEADARVEAGQALAALNDADTRGEGFASKDFRATASVRDQATNELRDALQEGNNFASKTFTATIVARDLATSVIQGIQGKTVYVTVRQRGSTVTRSYYADGGILGGDGVERMERGGVVDGIQRAIKGGAYGLFNGRLVNYAENGGDELFLNQYSRPTRQVDLIRNFAGGSLDRTLRAHYQGSSEQRLDRLTKAVETLARNQTAGSAPGEVHVTVATPIADPVLAAKEIGRQTVRQTRAAARSRRPVRTVV